MLSAPQSDKDRPFINISEFPVDIIIHEAKNLLTIIRLSSEMLMDDADQMGKQLGSSINKAGSKLEELLNSHEKLYAISKGTYQPELKEELILNKISALLEEFEIELANKQLKLNFDRQEAYEVLVTDWYCLDLALRNILKNAIEASPAGETITISLQKKFDGFYIEVNNAGEVPPDVIPHFFTVHRHYLTAKRGMGTFIIKKMIEALGGRVSLHTDKESGTSLRIVLP